MSLTGTPRPCTTIPRASPCVSASKTASAASKSSRTRSRRASDERPLQAPRHGGPSTGGDGLLLGPARQDYIRPVLPWWLARSSHDPPRALASHSRRRGGLLLRRRAARGTGDVVPRRGRGGQAWPTLRLAGRAHRRPAPKGAI